MRDDATDVRKIRDHVIPRLADLEKIWHPEWFQGRRKRKNYFEGWYMKHVSGRGDSVLSFIPGISLNKEEPHAFVQVIKGDTGDTWYFRFPPEAFSYASNAFDIRIGNNRFFQKGIYVDLHDDGEIISGEISYANIHHFPVSLKTPGIMGWYRYVPLMQCYHGLVSMDHDLQGSIRVNSKTHEFSNGKGYVEKDWGSSMPEAWIWMQSNHFSRERTSMMLSIARIPWLGSSFPGFLGFLLHEGKEHYFATHTGAKIKTLEVSETEVSCTIEGRDFLLHIYGVKESSPEGKGALKAPGKGNMERVIHESVNAELHILLTNKKGEPVFEDTGTHAGLEVIGETSLLQP